MTIGTFAVVPVVIFRTRTSFLWTATGEADPLGDPRHPEEIFFSKPCSADAETLSPSADGTNGQVI
ncbi:MAG: hypothetical protein ACYCQJ_13110 [Nitrososphaerales archaeon]